MDRLSQRMKTAERALNTLAKVLMERKTEIVRDAAIQRFEYTFEAVWKAGQLFLREREGLQAASPKAAIRAFGEVELLNEDQVSAALQMADDRNLTVHTYNEDLAEALYGRLPGHARLLGEWLQVMIGPKPWDSGGN